MPNSPGTVSRILWHFTGGPRWNEVEQRQERKRKSMREAYRSLFKIVDSKKLKLGGYREVFRATEQVFGPTVIRGDKIEDIELTFLNEHRSMESSNVCCVADIPIMHLPYHAKRYGRFAVGFHRESIANAGFCPVFYQRFDSNLPAMLHSLWTNVNQAYAAKLHETLARYATRPEGDAETCDDNGHTEFDYETGNARYVDWLLEKATQCLAHMLPYVKTFTNEEFDVIYTEREWRATTEYNFRYDDVAMIVLPRSGGYFQRFIKQSEKLSILRAIPIIPWEDLVEH